MLETGQSLLRRCLARGDPADFPRLEEARTRGETDYVALVHRFAADGTIGEMDCVYSAWASDAPDGFEDAPGRALARLVPSLALAVKCASLTRVAGTLVETYLGRDAGRRVLAGRIARGVADRIDAVLWFSDLRGYTRITETRPPRGGHPAPQRLRRGGDLGRPRGRRRRLEADRRRHARHLQGGGPAGRLPLRAPGRGARPAADRRGERPPHRQGLPVTKPYLGLHIGEVFYGNIGSTERLDFTVIGPAVNEVSRIAAMCRSADQDVLLFGGLRRRRRRRGALPLRLGRPLCAARRGPAPGAVHAGAWTAVAGAMMGPG